jgi:hypothetical protein
MADKFILYMAQHTPKSEVVSELQRRIIVWKEDQTEDNWKNLSAIAYMVVLKDALEDHGGVDGTAKLIQQIKDGVELIQRMKM